MNILRRRKRERGWVGYGGFIEDYRPGAITRLIAWGARHAWAIRHPDLAADMRRRQQWWKEIEQFPAPVYGLRDNFMELKLTWAHPHSDLGVVQFGFQRQPKRPAIGIFISSSRKSAGDFESTAKRLHSLAAVVWHTAIAYGHRAQASELTEPGRDPLERIQLQPLRTISAAIPGFPRRFKLHSARELDVLVTETDNGKTGLIIAARGLEIDQIERLTRHVGIVQEHRGLLNKYRNDFRARQRAMGYVVDY